MMRLPVSILLASAALLGTASAEVKSSVTTTVNGVTKHMDSTTPDGNQACMSINGEMQCSGGPGTIVNKYHYSNRQTVPPGQSSRRQQQAMPRVPPPPSDDECGSDDQNCDDGDEE